MSRTLVCAIQIGTSRICAAAAWRDTFGNYEIAAIEQEPCEGCVRRGCVVDIDQTASLISNLVLKLSSRVKTEGCPGIDAAYVGINGISLHSETFHPNAELEDGTSVDGEVTAALKQKSRQTYIPGYDILDVETMGYTLDDVDCLNPNGRTGSDLTAHHQLIVAQVRLRLAVRSAMKLAGVRLVEVFATPYCVSKILTPDEKQRGCVLVDLGHSLTSVSVYCDGALQHLATIPLGSNAVTQDLARAKNITEEEAEKLKMTQEELDIVARCRYEEIIANVLHQIELSGCKERLAAGCILTGGGSRQRGITTLFGERLGLNRIMVRAFSGLVYGVSDRKPELAALTTLLTLCTADCAIDIPEEKEPDLFSDEEFESQDSIVADEEAATVAQQDAEQEPTGGSAIGKPSKGSGLSRFFRDLISGIDD